MLESLFHESQTPTEVIGAICERGPQRWDDLNEADRSALGVGKLRLAGVYGDRFDGTFMLRTRIAGGRLSARQLFAVASIVQDFAVGYQDVEAPDRFAEITTRQDLQIHWLRFENLPEIWRRFQAVGLGSNQACGNTLRNVTACPVDGVDARAIMDVGGVVDAIERLSIADERLTAFLPRKFKVAITGCASDCVIARVNCLAFTPARSQGELGFNVHVGGGLSDYPRLASQLDIFVVPDEVPLLTRAVLEVFAELGDYEHQSINRFRALVHNLGAETIADEIRRRTPSYLAAAGEALSTWKSEDHLGVHQDRSGTSFVGLCVPLGRLTANDLAEVARLATDYGDGQIRLTQRQNLILSGIRDVAGLLAEPLVARFQPQPDPFERSVVACTSAPFCRFAILPMKRYGAELIDYLRSNVPREYWDRLQGLRIHLSGCKASCAQVPLAHIGLRGTMGKTEAGYFDAFDIALGGDAGAGTLAHWTAGSVPVDRAFAGIASLLAETASKGASLAEIGAARKPISEEFGGLGEEADDDKA